MSSDPSAELEIFRKQWKEEVTARAKGSASGKWERSAHPLDLGKSAAGRGEPSKARRPPRYSRLEEATASRAENEASGDAEPHTYHDLEDKDIARRLGSEGEGSQPSVAAASKTPSSALEHYERAVEREEQGNFGDSVTLYRKAYRLDAGVDRIYRNKHFPPTSTASKPTNPNPSNAPVTVPGTAHHSLDGPPASTTKPSISQLIASFAGHSIPPVAPETEQAPQPPCPIATVPNELLIDILFYLAVADVASFSRLSLVCKHLAHLVATEDSIWQDICLGPKYGFPGMHYDWACSISGDACDLDTTINELDVYLQPNPDPEHEDNTTLLPNLSDLSLASPPPLRFPLSPTYPSHRTMFRTRPRLRFNGCYISTVNYSRPGSSTPSQVSWNTPVHIVTYYRYLRFFRDGTCVSLLTTSEPLEVVHHLCKANLPALNGGSGEEKVKGASLLPPMSIMQHALRGRWKLSRPSDPSLPTSSSAPPNTNNTPQQEPEGILTIETVGIDPEKYNYVMSLSVRSSGRASGTRNNKLAWRGFWSYNKLTDDWAEFGLRNDRAFFWSRVGSYGAGE